MYDCTIPGCTWQVGTDLFLALIAYWAVPGETTWAATVIDVLIGRLEP